ncbi:MAG: transcription initiation factor IIB [Candidatus Lokiarchaeota archaeon]|nr:transcription initiation factor IIB [Candidatus Lokiarchaeota archaeon]
MSNDDNKKSNKNKDESPNKKKDMAGKGTVDSPCCDEPLIKEEDGFFVCQNCGMVHEEKVLDSSPRRAFTQEEITKRKVAEPVYSPIGPRTVIKGKRDAKGSLLSPEGKQKYRRLAKIHRSLTTSYERNLWIALPNLQRLQERLNLPDTVAEDALRIYTNAVKKKLTMGRSIDMLLAASIFTALRVHGIPRPIEEILAVAELPKKNVMKSYRLIYRKILPEMNLQVTRTGPIQYIDKFIGDLKLSMDVRNKAVRILKIAKRSGMRTAGKDPKGLAAASIYMAAKLCGEPKTQNEVANSSHVTEVTLRMRQKELKKYYLDRIKKKKNK